MGAEIPISGRRVGNLFYPHHLIYDFSERKKAGWVQNLRRGNKSCANNTFGLCHHQTNICHQPSVWHFRNSVKPNKCRWTRKLEFSPNWSTHRILHWHVQRTISYNAIGDDLLTQLNCIKVVTWSAAGASALRGKVTAPKIRDEYKFRWHWSVHNLCTAHCAIVIYIFEQWSLAWFSQ